MYSSVVLVDIFCGVFFFIVSLIEVCVCERERVHVVFLGLLPLGKVSRDISVSVEA